MRSDSDSEKSSMNHRYSELIQSSLDMIENNLGNISIDELAVNAFFSKYHFQRLFHAIVGDPVMEYVKKRRLESAGKDLRDTHISILDIALKYGYNSHEGFTRAFKGFYGITPYDFRKGYRAYTAPKTGSKSGNLGTPNHFIDSVLQLGSHFKEGLSMNTGKIILGDSGLDDFLNILSGCATSAKEISIKTQSIVENNPNGKGVLILSLELKSLSGRVDSACNEIRNFFESDNNTAFESYNMMFKIIKVLDDLAFQTNLLKFIGIIEIERTGQRDYYQDVITGLNELCERINIDKQKMNRIINDMIALISADIQNEAITHYNKAVDYISKCEAEGIKLYEDIVEATKVDKRFKAFLTLSEMISSNNRAMAEIVEKMRNHSDEAQKADSVTAFISSLEMRNKNVLHDLEDMAFFTNIVAFAAAVEAARIGISEIFPALADRIRLHAGAMQKCAKDCEYEWNEAKNTMSIFDKNPSVDKAVTVIAKTLDDICYQDKIMSYHLTLEAKRLSDPIIEAIAESLAKNTTRIKSAFDYINSSASSYDKAELKAKLEGYVSEMETITSSLNDAAVSEQRATFRYIAENYKNFAKRISEYIMRIHG